MDHRKQPIVSPRSEGASLHVDECLDCFLSGGWQPNGTHLGFFSHDSGARKIGVGKSGLAGLPSLRTVRAVFPHTALQLVVDGLSETKVGLSQTIKTSLRKVRIGPTLGTR